MILTCPECATGYFVEDGRIPPAGRLVRCTACGARWTASPPAPPPPAEPPHEVLAAEPALVATAPPPPEPAPPAPAAPEPASPSPAPPTPAAMLRTPAPTPRQAEDLPRAFRDRAEEEQRLRRAALTGAGWAGVLVLIAVIAGAALFFRDRVAGVWPQTASTYAALGFPVNLTGLQIEQVRAEPGLEAGRATLAVSGIIRNITDHPVSAPPLRISLVNAQGRRLAGQIATLANPLIPAGAQRRFATAIFDPPFSANALQIDFAIGQRPTIARRAATSPPRATAPAPGPPMPAGLRGPQPGGAASASSAAPTR